MENTKTLTLLTSIKLGNLTLKNRVAMAPMTRCRALGNVPTDLMVTYYNQRSTAGLIITEGTAPSANGLGYARTPGIFTGGQIAGWKKITDAVHAGNSKIFVQLMHVGRIAHSANMPAGARIVAPSAINAGSDMWTDSQGMQKTETPQALTADEISQTKNEFVQAAKNAIEAGFDGVELHSANGYLLEQFLNPLTNIRTDNYGGSVENRSRFLLEVIAETGKAIGFDKIGVRFSPYGPFNNMPAHNEVVETYTYLSVELNKLNIGYIHVLDFAARSSDEGLALLKQMRETFKPLFILNSGYTTERAEQVLDNNEADMVSFGSSYIANPDLPYKMAQGIEWNQADTATFYTADEKGYTDYPFHAN